MIFKNFGAKILRRNHEETIPSGSERKSADSQIAQPTNKQRSHVLETLYEDPADNDQSDSGLSNKRSLDDYQLVKVVGKGCMGKVLLGQERISGKFFAIKSISKKWVIEHGALEIEHTMAEQRILAELSRINHPFLISLHCSFQTQDNLFLVMPYVNGGDLATQLAMYGMFDLERSRLYCAEMVSGIAELHRLGIIYRDLKPENVLLTLDGHIKLTDFGLSKQFKLSVTANEGKHGNLCGSCDDCSCRTKTFCGTFEYLAPEILLEQPYSFEVDWWSLGTFLYEMLTGITPFWAENHAAMYKRVLEDRLEFPGHLTDSNAKHFIANLLIRNPKLRLGTGRDGSVPVMRHSFFSNISWPHLLQKRIPAPYKPQVESETDVKWFDQAFTDLTPKISPAPLDSVKTQHIVKALPTSQTPRVDSLFNGYSYMSSSAQNLMQGFVQANADTTRHAQKKRRRDMFSLRGILGNNSTSNNSFGNKSSLEEPSVMMTGGNSYEEESLAFRMDV